MISLFALIGRNESLVTGSAPISSSFRGVIHLFFRDRQHSLKSCWALPAEASAKPASGAKDAVCEIRPQNLYVQVRGW